MKVKDNSLLCFIVFFRKVVINAIFSFLAIISFVLMEIMFSMGSYINTLPACLILTEIALGWGLFYVVNVLRYFKVV